MGRVTKEEERLLLRISEITADVAAMKAENERLLDENTFLRSLVKKEWRKNVKDNEHSEESSG